MPFECDLMKWKQAKGASVLAFTGDARGDAPALHQGEAVLQISALGRWGGNKRLNYAGNTSLVFGFAFFSFSCLQLALVWKY